MSTSKKREPITIDSTKSTYNLMTAPQAERSSKNKPHTAFDYFVYLLVITLESANMYHLFITFSSLAVGFVGVFYGIALAATALVKAFCVKAAIMVYRSAEESKFKKDFVTLLFVAAIIVFSGLEYYAAQDNMAMTVVQKQERVKAQTSLKSDKDDELKIAEGKMNKVIRMIKSSKMSEQKKAARIESAQQRFLVYKLQKSKEKQALQNDTLAMGTAKNGDALLYLMASIALTLSSFVVVFFHTVSYRPDDILPQHNWSPFKGTIKDKDASKNQIEIDGSKNLVGEVDREHQSYEAKKAQLLHEQKRHPSFPS